MTFNVIYPAAPAYSRVDSFAPAHPGIRPPHSAALGAGSELIVLVFEQDVERGERSVTARDVLLQVELVRIAQFAWHASLDEGGLLAFTSYPRERYPQAVVILYVIHV